MPYFLLSLNPSIKKEPFLNQLKFRKGYISFEIKGFLSNIPLILCIIFGVVWSNKTKNPPQQTTDFFYNFFNATTSFGNKV